MKANKYQVQAIKSALFQLVDHQIISREQYDQMINNVETIPMPPPTSPDGSHHQKSA